LDARQDFVWKRVCVHKRGSGDFGPDVIHLNKFPQNTYEIAGVYAFRNQSDEAFEWLDRAYVQRNVGLIETKVDPLLKSLHHDPRYAAFLKKLSLPN
jgi:hypothetical protein